MSKVLVRNAEYENATQVLEGIFDEFGIDPSKPIFEQEPRVLEDRERLDRIMFDQLGFTATERRDVYLATCDAIKRRLMKAKSYMKSQKN